MLELMSETINDYITDGGKLLGICLCQPRSHISDQTYQIALCRREPNFDWMCGLGRFNHYSHQVYKYRLITNGRLKNTETKFGQMSLITEANLLFQFYNKSQIPFLTFATLTKFGNYSMKSIGYLNCLHIIEQISLKSRGLLRWGSRSKVLGAVEYLCMSKLENPLTG